MYLDSEVDAARVVVSDEPIARTIRVEGFGLVHLDDSADVVAIELFRVSEQIAAMRRERDEHRPERDLDEELQASAAQFVDRARERVTT